MTEPVEGELARLRETVERLQSEIASLREDRRRRVRRRMELAGWSGRLITYVTVGPSLVLSLRNWIQAAREADPFPPDETAEVAAAVIRRVFRIGLIGLLVAVLPGVITGGLLVWQNRLIGEQVIQQTAQLEQQARDIEQRKQDNIVARRAQLIDILYSTENCSEAALINSATGAFVVKEGRATSPAYEQGRPFLYDPSMGCVPRAHLRARQEAALAYIKIERDSGARPDLYQVKLATGIFISADLSGAVLSGADLRYANLTSALLRGVDFSFADLGGALLADADLSNAILGGSNLVAANFHNAELRGADLRGADLEEAHLNQAQVNAAIGNSRTVLPPDLERPAHWTE